MICLLITRDGLSCITDFDYDPKKDFPPVIKRVCLRGKPITEATATELSEVGTRTYVFDSWYAHYSFGVIPAYREQ